MEVAEHLTTYVGDPIAWNKSASENR